MFSTLIHCGRLRSIPIPNINLIERSKCKIYTQTVLQKPHASLCSRNSQPKQKSIAMQTKKTARQNMAVFLQHLQIRSVLSVLSLTFAGSMLLLSSNDSLALSVVLDSERSMFFAISAFDLPSLATRALTQLTLLSNYRQTSALTSPALYL